MGILLCMVVLFVGNLASKAPYKELGMILNNLAVAFLALSVIAVVLTNFGRRETKTTSPDCIWYNLLLAALYATLGYFS